MKHHAENSWILVDPETNKAMVEVHSEEPPAPFDGSHFVNKRTGVCLMCGNNTFKLGVDVQCKNFVAMRPSEYLATLNKTVN